MTSRIWPLLLSLTIPGCGPTFAEMQRVESGYVGRNIDEFVLAHGIPAQKMVLNSGDVLYQWRSDAVNIDLPGTTTATSHTIDGRTTTTVQNTPDTHLSLLCELSILTGPEGTIKTVTITHDTWGKWTTSRCREIFR